MTDEDRIEVGFLVFLKVQQLDLTGPYEVLASWPKARVRLVGKTLDPVASSTGLVLRPDATFETCPQLGVICVPGGAGDQPAARRQRHARLLAQAGGERAFRDVGLHRCARSRRRRASRRQAGDDALGFSAISRHARRRSRS